MQVREVMTRDVVTAGPEDSVKEVGAVLAERGFAAVPVVSDDRLVGIVAEADILRGRALRDPRLHLRRDPDPAAGPPPPALVRDVMTTEVRTVEDTADVADIAALLAESRFRSVPVMHEGRLAGMVSRRDLLRALVRSDEAIAQDLLTRVEEYTGEPGGWAVTVSDGTADVRRTSAGGIEAADARALRALGATVAGIVAVRVPGGEEAGG